MARSFVTRLVAGLALVQLPALSVLAQTQTISEDDTLAATSIPTTTAPTALASPTSSREPQTFTITAGAGSFKFTPQEISNVSVGDTVNFEFYPPDHSVARADFGSACVPYEYTGKNRTGFWSTTQWVKDTTEITHWTLPINTTEPIFFYCAAPNSCIGEHMVGVINPNSTHTLDLQIDAAKNADFQVAPGNAIPAEAASSTTFANAPTSSPSQGTAPVPPSHTSGSSHKLSPGAIAGIVVGAVAFLAVCAALFYFVGRAKSLKEHAKRKHANANATPDPHSSLAMSMSQYGSGGLGSPGHHHVSTGYPSPVPFGSPGQSEYGFAAAAPPPGYGMHGGGGEQYQGGWVTPTAQQQQAHLSMGSGVSGLSQQQIDELKYARTSTQAVLAELQSPTPGQEGFSVELEAQGRK
ncbi:hypothetical protein T440DRAFT_464587 [Plenodomus tracheiphilus IPT5]|uniref:Extracellular serine-rich protein n=1 Tax=Plenodomus tracheiphilus IPT5 TaxID=1408161 RepID=A0A6A7BJ96_9PLEO|nr:hypothetical protein T440DRAFT_464587 [Plenodomus tracheiphilus IPT5]